MEGPSLVILREEVEIFKGKKILECSSYKLDEPDLLVGKTVTDFKTWGKHFLICFKGFTVWIHYGLFGGYRINNRKTDGNPSLGLTFRNGTFDSHVASVKILQKPVDELYDWRLDMLSEEWDPKYVKKKLQEQSPDKQIGDLLLNADIFSGVGNIIRCEVLYRVKIHPESLLGNIPAAKLMAMIKETGKYSWEFLELSRKHQLSKHWKVYARKKCPKGHVIEKKVTGKTKRNSFICRCMVKYDD